MRLALRPGRWAEPGREGADAEGKRSCCRKGVREEGSTFGEKELGDERSQTLPEAELVVCQTGGVNCKPSSNAYQKKAIGTLISAMGAQLSEQRLKQAKILFIGTGGGGIPTYLRGRWPTMQLVMVDLDGNVLALAKDHMGLPQGKLANTFVKDGRSFLHSLRSS